MTAAAGAATLLAAGAGESARGQLIVFASDRALNRQPEIYTVQVGRARPFDVSRRPARDEEPSWSPDGRRLAFTSFPGGLQVLVVARADGHARRVLARERDVGWIPAAVSWSPNGRSIAFAARKGVSELIWVVSVATGKRRSLAAGDRPRWSPDGKRLAFVRNGALWVMRSNGAAAKQLTTIAEWIGDFAWSPNGRRIAFATYFGGVRTVDAESGALTSVDAGSGSTAFTRPSWSRDARSLVYARSRSDPAAPPWAIVVAGADGSGIREIASGTAPLWSPSGRWISFVRRRADRDEAAVVRPDGREERAVGSGPAGTWVVDALEAAFAWSRGERLAYAAWLGRNDDEIYSMRPDGSRVRRLTTNHVHDVQPRLSPDGSRIAFVRAASGEAATVQSASVYVMRAEGNGVRRVAMHGVWPSWSPDGREIAFTAQGPTDAPRIAVVPAGGGAVRQIADGAHPAWSPAGAGIAYVAQSGVQEPTLRLVQPDGGRDRALISLSDVRPVVPDLGGSVHEVAFGSPSWTPNGKQLAFVVSWRDVRTHRRLQGLLVDADGSDLRLAPFGAADSPVAWSPDGRRVALARAPTIAVGPAGGPEAALRSITGDWVENRDPDWGPRR